MLVLALSFVSGLPAQDTNALSGKRPLPPGNLRVVSSPDAKPAAPTLEYPAAVQLLPGRGPAPKSDSFSKIWRQRRILFWQDHDRDRGAVVFLGDSIIQRWTGLASDFPNLKTANRGIEGDTTRGVLYRLQGDVLDLDPAAVVLLVGSEDIAMGADLDDLAYNLRLILAALKKYNPRLPVIVCDVMPSDPLQQRPPERIKAFNVMLDDMVKEDAQCVRCDTWSLYAGDSGNCKKADFPDSLHPNKEAYEKWAAALRPILASLHLDAGKTE